MIRSAELSSVRKKNLPGNDREKKIARHARDVRTGLERKEGTATDDDSKKKKAMKITAGEDI